MTSNKFNVTLLRNEVIMYFKLRSLFIIVIVLGSSIPCFAQHSIKGRVIDEHNEPLTYATVVLLSPADSTMHYFDITDKKGLYQIKISKQLSTLCSILLYLRR